MTSISSHETGPAWLRRAPSLAGAILLASVLIGGWAYWRDHMHAQAVEQDRALIVTSERLLSALKDVETGERGFIITGRDQYLEPFLSGTAAVPVEEATIAPLLGPDASKLFDLIAARLKEAADGIAIDRRDGQAAGAATIDTGVGKRLMDQIRVEIAHIQHSASDRIDALRAGERLDDVLRIASVVGLVFACAFLGWMAILRRREQQASQRLFEGVLENAPVGLGILDPSLHIRHINHALAKMSERALSAVPGMSIWDVVPQLRETLETRLQRVVQGGRAASADVDAVSNTRADQIRSYQVNFYPLAQASAVERAGVGMVIADVTARKRAERATKESEERFRSLVQASASIIWTADPTGAFVSPQPNWTRFTGQPAEASLGWGRLACLHPDDVEATRAAWGDAALDGKPIALEHRVRRADGVWRYMALSVASVREDGSIREWIGSHTDITDRKEAELALEAAKEAAEAANRAKSSFLANMSHELRTPLSAVIGYSEMLEEEAEDKGENAMLTDLAKIKSNAKHLLGLINDVLDLSKVEANKMDTFAEEIDISAFVRDAANTVETLVQQKSNELILDLGADLGTMHSDAVKLRQCLFNLLSNAAKFTEGGIITLSARRELAAKGDWLLFAVQDTGIGMTPDQLARLFQRFAQADETTTRKFGGTGLGLALSRAFARLLGGDIEVASAEGQGTTFTLRVPAALPTPMVAEPEAHSTPEVQGTGDLVLVIDDEASQRDLMTRFLKRQGFAVRTAADGKTGLELAGSLSPRVILLDVMMPGMDGWSVLSALKSDPGTAEIPVVMVSFVADASVSAAMGAADAVPKPVNWTRLKTVVDGFREGGGDVMVVDDDDDLRQRLRSFLEKNGWTVREATNGAEALDRVTHLPPPQLILLDLTMPVMDGFSFLHKLRQTPNVSDIPVIVFSARDISAAERDQLSEADRILNKGETSMRDLAAQIRELREEHHIEGSKDA